MSNHQVESIINLPALAIQGLQVSNNATTPDSIVDISAGACRDSANNVDMVLGANNPNDRGRIFVAPLEVNASVNGANGLDAGALANNNMYAVYLIGDSQGYNDPAGLISLASNASPLIPTGYDSLRKIGFMGTDGTADFVPGFIEGNGSERKWVYNGAQTALSAGASATYATVSLAAFVPNLQNGTALIESSFTAAAANDLLRMRNFSASGDQINVLAPVAGATAVTQNLSPVQVGLNSGVPSIDYTVSAGTVNLFVMGYQFAL